MNKTEFLQQLREALATDLSSRTVEENIRYYSQYISDEERKGRTEEEILNELGDPWLIAKTIINTGVPEEKNAYDSSENNDYQGYGRRSDYDGIKVYRVDTWWKKALLIVGVIAVIGLILSLITGVVSLLAPVLVPILIIAIIINLLKR
mgnify:FL=1